MPPDETPCPDADTLDSLLAVYLLDLRAHFEAALRLLTEAHRHLERYRTGGTEAKIQARAGLLQQLTLLVAANVTVGDALAEAVDQADRLTDHSAPAAERTASHRK